MPGGRLRLVDTGGATVESPHIVTRAITNITIFSDLNGQTCPLVREQSIGVYVHARLLSSALNRRLNTTALAYTNVVRLLASASLNNIPGVI